MLPFPFGKEIYSKAQKGFAIEASSISAFLPSHFADRQQRPPC